jgi:hypothetical protein
VAKNIQALKNLFLNSHLIKTTGNRMKKFLNHTFEQRKFYGIIIFSVIFVIGIGLRTMHYGDLLVFKSDQARDALIMEQAVKGSIFKLSLLGPQVSGTSLRLGPISYYFQYFSGKLFGATPESLAYPDLIWGILTLPILFLLLRRFFPLALSFWLTALGSVSLFLVTFSRFGWNPNGLPFFSTLFAWSFLSVLESKGRSRLWLLGIAAVCVGVIAQLHLMSILGLLLGLVVFLIFSRALRWQEIALCAMIVMTLNFPVLLNEWQTNGGNAQSFIKAVTKKGPQSDGHAWHEKIFRAYQELAGVTWLIATGQQNTEMIPTKGFSIKCDKKCQTALPYSLLAIIMLGYILISVYWAWKSAVANVIRKRALAFMATWLGNFFFATILVAYQVETRFYLGLVPVIFVFLGFAIEQSFNSIKNIWIKRMLMIAGIIVILLNFQATAKYLRELSNSQISADESGRDLRFGTAPKVTLGQLRNIANEANRRFTTHAPVFIFGESHYVKAMYYLLSVEHGRKGCYFKGTEKNIPAGFSQLFIVEADDTSDNKTDYMTFGTLAATFEATASLSTDAPLPKGCLTY